MENLKKISITYGELLQRIIEAGGSPILVGGVVRDAFLNISNPDLDIEVYGLAPTTLKNILSSYDEVLETGKSFGVFKLKNYPVDISLPRRDSKIGKGHRDFSVTIDAQLSFKEATERRDLTINSMGYDPTTEAILDPFGGREDLKNRVLRPTNPFLFADDPLRPLRVAQLAARFEMNPVPSLKSLCQRIDISEVPGERILEEFRKLLIKGREPSRVISFLKDTGLLDQILPEFETLSSTELQQTCSILNRGAELLKHENGERAFAIMLCLLTQKLISDRLLSSIFSRLKLSSSLRKQILALRYECEELKKIKAPEIMKKSPYLWIGRRLLDQGLDWIDLLIYLRSAYGISPWTTQIMKQVFSSGALDSRTLEPAVCGQDLIKKGFQPGEQFKELLKKCLDVQFSKGETSVPKILDIVLSE